MGKKDQQDCPGSEVQRKVLWKKMGLGRHQKAGLWFREANTDLPLSLGRCETVKFGSRHTQNCDSLQINVCHDAELLGR